MGQILDQIKLKSSPYALNGFINRKTISIVRDNPADKAHFGKPIPLKIYDRNEIVGGTSVYQIAEQPRFTPRYPIFPKRRGEFMLLINGMPVIHAELKRSKVDVTQAAHQIQNYAHEGVFRGRTGCWVLTSRSATSTAIASRTRCVPIFRTEIWIR